MEWPEHEGGIILVNWEENHWNGRAKLIYNISVKVSRLELSLILQ